MKKLFVFLCVMFLFFGLARVANAALLDRGGGLIYDDVLDITWLQDANYAGTYMDWFSAMSWAASLSYYDSVRDVYYDDWRLPTTPGTGIGNLNEGEMAHLHFDDGITPTSPGPFSNVLPTKYYWSGTSYATSPNQAWTFSFDYSNQSRHFKNYALNYAWAVSDGDVVGQPQPLSIFEDFIKEDQGKRFGVDLDEMYNGFDWGHDTPEKIATWGSFTVQDSEAPEGNDSAGNAIPGADGSENWVKARAADVGKGAKITNQNGFFLESMELYTDEDNPAFLSYVEATWRAIDNTTSSGHVINLIDDTWITVTAADLGAEDVELKAIWFNGSGITNPNGAKFGLDNFTVRTE